MKKLSLYALITALVFAWFTFNGFQCGSTELTSAKLYIQRSDWPNAEAALVKEVQKNPADAEGWYDLGYVRYNLANYPGMLDAFTQSLKVSDQFKTQIQTAKGSAWALLFNRGVSDQNRMLTASKDSVSILSNDAINSYRQSITINPDSAATYQNMAALFHNTGQTDSEIVYWNLARQHKNDPLFTSYIIDGYIRLGDEATTKGDTATEHKDDLAAVAELQKAFQDNPNDTLLLPAMINLYIKLGRTADAMPYMKKALDNNPNDKTLQNNYGLLLLQQGNFQEAIDHIGMVLKADSNDIDGLRNESVAYLRLGEQKKKAEMDKAAKGGKVEKTYLSDFQNAAHLLERLTSIKSDDADLYEALGTAYANCGMNKQAEAALKSADRLRKK